MIINTEERDSIFLQRKNAPSHQLHFWWSVPWSKAKQNQELPISKTLEEGFHNGEDSQP